MAEVETTNFLCDRCGLRFVGRATSPGGQLRCRCGNLLLGERSAHEAEGLYDLATDAPKPRPATASAAPPLAMPATPVLAYRTPKDESRVADTEPVKDLWMPLWLLGGGTLIQVTAALLTHRGAFLGALAHIGAHLIGGTALMLIGVLLAAKFRGIRVGPFWIAAFKVAAIAVATGAFVDLTAPIWTVLPFGGIFGLLADFVVYFTLLGALFDLDESDTWYCLSVIFLVHRAVYFLLPQAL